MCENVSGCVRAVVVVQAGASGVDCSLAHHELALGTPVTSEPRTFLEDTLQVGGRVGEVEGVRLPQQPRTLLSRWAV